MFDKCVKGLFSKKAVVMITHQIEFLPRCDAGECSVQQVSSLI